MSIVFALNGKTVSVPTAEVDPLMPLIEFIRTKTEFKGTKLACGEGGCGACTVVLSRCEGDKVQSMSVNSCLRPLASCDGWAITTTEGLGSSTTAFHPIQERIASFNGLQCGFCTPGFVMSMYSTLNSPEAKAGGGLTMAQLEDSLDGNICRCTGYRPILDFAKSFAKDSNVKDLVCKTSSIGPYDHQKCDPGFPADLKTYTPAPLNFTKDGVQWIRPTSVAGVLAALEEAEKKKLRAKLVAGSTSTPFDKRHYPIMIDIHKIQELQHVAVEGNGLRVGGGVSLTDLGRHLRTNVSKSSGFGPLEQQLHRLSNRHVRNVATVAGNIMLAKTIGFPSDLTPALLAMKATIKLTSKQGSHDSNITDFLANATLNAGELIESIFIPFLGANTHYNSYKSSLRSRGAYSDVSAAFSLSVEKGAVTEAVMAFGVIGLPRATELENFLKGKPLNKETLRGALRALKGQLKKQTAAERTAAGFLYKFLVPLLAEKLPARVASASVSPARPVTTSSQAFKYQADHAPVSEPIAEVSGKMKASGEARYADDMPTLPGTLYAQHVVSAEGRAKVTSIDASEALKMPGVVRFIGASDIPGVNNESSWGVEDPLFADNEVRYCGQSHGLIVADTPSHARRGAAAVVVRYERSGAPVITTDQAKKEEGNFFVSAENSRGDWASLPPKAAHTVTGRAFMNTQLHFYMEPQTSYVIPDEDKLTVYVSTQMLGHVSQVCAAVCKLSHKDINVINRRAGGAFGGKLTHQNRHAAACAIAARVLRVPVRMAVDRAIDCGSSGGREEMTTTYDVSFDKDGKISQVKLQTATNAGHTVGLAFFANMTVAHASNEVYDWKYYHHKADLYKTNLPGRTPMRAPGDIQASFIAETIIDHVSKTIGVSPETVRERNFYTFTPAPGELLPLPNGQDMGHWTLPRMWPLLKNKVDFDKRKQEVEDFNKDNRWRKRGISMVPIRYQVAVHPRQALVNIYDDGSVLITQDGCEMGQGLYTKCLQTASYALGKLLGPNSVPMDKIRMADTASAVTPNASFTGGSTGSEGACEAVKLCCEQLLARLKTVDINALAATKSPVSWVEVCAAAANASVHLSAVARWKGNTDQELTYQNLGVACSTAEVDVITGDLTILSSHLVYDCGKSLNPAIDIGQAEGAFVMGLGFYFTEKPMIARNGRLISNNTWHYKPPLASDVPLDFTVEFLQDSGFNKGILSSKCSGEPPLCLASSAMFAVKEAIYSARKEIGVCGFFELPTPATPADILTACGTEEKHLTLAAVADDAKL